MQFQLAKIDGSNVKTSDNKVHNFSITKIGRKTKRTQMSEPTETIIVRA